MVHPSAQVPERANLRVPIFCSQREMGSQPLADFGMEPRRGCTDCVPDKRLLNRIGQRKQTSQQFKLQKDVFSVCSRHSNHGQNDISQGRERLSSRSKVSRLPIYGVSLASHAINDTKYFDVLNQTIGGNARLRMPVKVDCYRHDANCKIVDTRHDILSPVRKRRSVNSSRPNDGPSLVSSSLTKQTYRCNATSGKDRGFSSHSTFGSTQLQESIYGDSDKNGINSVSFTFRSPTRQKTGIHADVEVRRDRNGENGGFAQKRTTSNEIEGNRSSLKTLPISGDSLGALLEQKLKELTCQEEEDSAFGYNMPKKTTAMILQELISALTTERPFHQNNLPHGQQSKRNPPTIFQAKPISINSSNAHLPISEHSPGSVLEVSFSNDSCCSSSLDDGSRCCNQGVDSTECYEGPHLLEPDVDVSDSASSLGMGKFYRDSLKNLLNNISEVLSIIELGDIHLRGSKLNHAKEVILNAELVFGNAAALPDDDIVNGGFSTSHFVLNQLELLAMVMRSNFSGLVAFHKKDGNQLKGLAFDCFIDYLESRFSRYSNSGFNAWTRLPLRMKTEMLICEIVEEVGRWVALAGLFPDELIEHEMSHCLGKWTDFELETFETGIEMDQQILQMLISEILVDLTGCC